MTTKYEKCASLLDKLTEAERDQLLEVAMGPWILTPWERFQDKVEKLWRKLK